MLITILTTIVVVLGLFAYYIYFIAPKFNPLNRAQAYERQNMFHEAIMEYKRALDSKPDDFVVHYRLARLYLELNELDQAAIHLEKIIAINKYNYEIDRLDVQRKLAKVYYFREEIESAFQMYLDILRQYPGDIESLYHVSFISLGQEEFDIAQKYFDRLAKLDKNEFESQFGAGIASYQTLRNAEAIEYFRNAITLKPTSTVAYIALGFALLRIRDYRQAIGYLSKLLEISTDLDAVFIARRLSAFMLVLSKKNDEAVKMFEELLSLARKNEMDDETALTLYDLGFACIRAERTNHAYGYWNELYQLDRTFRNIDHLVTLLRKEMDTDYKLYRDDFDASVNDYVDEWLASAFPQGFLWDICGLKSDKTLDIKNIMVTKRVSVARESGGGDSFGMADYGDLVTRYCQLDTENFRIISNRLVAKLGYRVDQILPTYREADGVDFLAVNTGTKEKVLIWIRRWTKSKVGEIPLRNFAQAINDIKASNGLFITAAELTQPAEEALKRLSRVSVIYPDQLGSTLSGLL